MSLVPTVAYNVFMGDL